MGPLLNAKGQPVKISFFDLFGPNKASRSGEACSLLQRGKVSISLIIHRTLPVYSVFIFEEIERLASDKIIF